MAEPDRLERHGLHAAAHPDHGQSGTPGAGNGTRSQMRVRLYYLATATVQFHGPTGANTVSVQRVFVRAGRDLFDNFFFGTPAASNMTPAPKCT